MVKFLAIYLSIYHKENFNLFCDLRLKAHIFKPQNLFENKSIKHLT